MSAKVNEITFHIEQPTLTVGMEIKDSIGSTYTVRGFMCEPDPNKPNFYHGFAILQRGNGRKAYTLSVTGSRKMWNRNIISTGDEWDDIELAKLYS